MNISTINSNILNVASDALIYSTNTKLLLTGGVGAQLVEVFGSGIQTKLINHSVGFGVELAEIGDVISCKTDNMPWKKVIHTVCSDGSYIIDAKIIEHVLIKALKICDKESAIKKVTISALGTGYGTLSLKEFIEILNKVCVENRFHHLTDIIICLVKGARH